MVLVTRWLSRLALLVHLACVHLALFRLWYASGVRNMFTRKENVHVKDLQLAVALAEGRGEASAPAVRATVDTAVRPPLTAGRLALLFMLRGRLEQLEAWRLWLLEAEELSLQRLSLYFHMADRLGDNVSAFDNEVALLRSLPGFRQVVPTVATGWCELMAAEVALLKAALADDPSAQLFVFLPHDSVPFAPVGTTLATLVPIGAGAPPRTRICPAGVRGMDVPYECPHGIEPHWSRSLLLKHHQWMAVNRQHAERLTDGAALRVAVDIFEEWFLGEPVCSDEVLPLLALAGPAVNPVVRASRLVRTASPVRVALADLPLYRAAAWGLASFDRELRAMGAAQECLLYAPWPGCHQRQSGGNKRAKSPVVGGGLAPDERDALIRELAAQGVLFGRKLGVARGSAREHIAWIHGTSSVSAGTALPPAPRRLLPESGSTTPLTWLKWGLACFEAGVPLPLQVLGTTVGAACAGWLAVVGGGISPKWMQRLLGTYLTFHFVVFFSSIAFHPEYSFLEPFRADRFDGNPWYEM